MPRGYWRIVLTIVGIVALVGLSAVTGQLYHASEQEHSDYRYQPAREARFIQFVPSKTIPKGYQPDCQNPQTDENADLCAQWASVDQSAEANRMSSLNLKFAIASLWATAIATLLLVWTLIETRETSRRELRAYVSVQLAGHEFTQIEDKGLLITSKIISHNGGSTPAYRCNHFGDIQVMPESVAQVKLSRIIKIKDDSFDKGYVIHAGSDFTTEFKNPKLIPFDIMEKVKSGELLIYSFGVASYVDTFGIRRRTDYCVSLGGKRFAESLKASQGSPGDRVEAQWTITSFHNEAT